MAPSCDETRVAARPHPTTLPSPALGTLTILRSPDARQVGWSLPLRGEEVFLGREGTAHIPLNDPDVSRCHARVIVRDAVHRLSDMQSTNGSHVNGARVQETILKSGDTILLGSTALRYERAQ